MLSVWWKPWSRRPLQPAPVVIIDTASTQPETPSAALLSAANLIVDDDASRALTAERRVRFFRWLLGEAPPTRGSRAPPRAEAIGQLLERLDLVIASEPMRAALLPRAPDVVPQLMKTLRDDSYSSAEVASRISRDAVLTAEVIRSAASATDRVYGEGEADLAWAIAAIGTQGLRRAISTVLLRPMFGAGGDSFSARAAARIWKNADNKARRGATLATQRGLDPLDGYLAGLLHEIGWTALLRAIDNCKGIVVGADDLTHPDVVPELLRRRDALFGALVGPWNLGPAMSRLADEVGAAGIDAAASPLGLSLREADRRAMLDALSG